MKNKGFTLIELLAVIAIIGILGTIVTISFAGSIKTSNQKECYKFVEQIETAACTYVGLSYKDIECERATGCVVTLEKLVTEGIIDYEVDKCTKSTLDLTQTITVTWDEFGEKICIYNGVKEYEG